MKKELLFLLLACCTTVLYGQQKYTISGYIQDAATGEKLISANAYEAKTATGTVSNTYGFFSLTLPKDSVELTFSYIGYQPIVKKFYLDKNTELEIDLQAAVELATVEVTAEHYEKIEESTQMSQVEVPVEQIKKLPALLGEVDIMKTLQLLPGVQSGGEGQSGLYVRGGSPDQNLVLLDGVPIYNVSHLLGIFSVFNADAIKNVTLTKGGFPARYGGRLSSVLEINMKEGNMQEFHGEGAIGLISSKLTLEGPIVKGKTSFLVSGRRTYADLIFKPIIKSSTPPDEALDLSLYFYDLNAKIQHKFNNKHRLYLSIYNGSDNFGTEYTDMDSFGSETYGGGIKWGNLISAARWNWQINPQLFANTTLTYSDYSVNINSGYSATETDGTSESFQTKYISGIEDVAAKIDFDYIPNPKHYIRFGANATRHKYSPGALTLKADIEDNSLDTLIGSQNEYSMEYQLYIEDDINLGALKTNVGLHSSLFNVNGKNYTSIQPRIGMRYLLNNNWALKASYSSMAQYINLLTLEGFSLPSDLWVPSTEKTLPQRAWQTAAGVARTFGDGYEVSIEGFYKKMRNLISYKDGASFLFGLDSDWEDKITQGDGEAYGAEFFIQKKKGKTTGWIGYTLSWNWRHFDELNSGQRYPFRYDRRHDISVVVSHDFSEKISASAAWVYGTGNAVTLNTLQYPTSVSGNPGNYYFNNVIETGAQKNAFRMSDYHRLDLSIEFKKIRPKWERRWIISVYNTYYRRNPYFMIIDNQYVDDGTGNFINKKVLKEVSILPIIPSFSYAFKF